MICESHGVIFTGSSLELNHNIVSNDRFNEKTLGLYVVSGFVIATVIVRYEEFVGDVTNYHLLTVSKMISKQITLFKFCHN